MEVFAEFINEWRQLGSGWNWRTFHPVMIEVEDDRMMGGVEATVIVLGLGVRVRWNYRETEEARDLARRIDELNGAPAPEPANGG
jgi:hypothetical protein